MHVSITQRRRYPRRRYTGDVQRRYGIWRRHTLQRLCAAGTATRLPDACCLVPGGVDANGSTLFGRQLFAQRSLCSDLQQVPVRSTASRRTSDNALRRRCASVPARNQRCVRRRSTQCTCLTHPDNGTRKQYLRRKTRSFHLRRCGDRNSVPVFHLRSDNRNCVPARITHNAPERGLHGLVWHANKLFHWYRALRELFAFGGGDKFGPGRILRTAAQNTFQKRPVRHTNRRRIPTVFVRAICFTRGAIPARSAAYAHRFILDMRGNATHGESENAAMVLRHKMASVANHPKCVMIPSRNGPARAVGGLCSRHATRDTASARGSALTFLVRRRSI